MEKDTSNVEENQEGSVEVSLEHMDVDVAAITWKVDLRVLPILFFVYAFQFMDKLALSSSSVFGVKTSNHLVGQDYSWVSAIFYFGFMAGQFPVARLLQVVPIGKFVGITVTLWGMVLACSAATDSYSGLLAARFFLGLLESAVSPAALFISSMYYTPEQLPLRTGIWFSGNDFGGVISAFITYGLGHIGGLPAWKYIFIFYGCVTCLYGVLVIFILPDSPQKASFFTEQEKEYYAKYRSQSKVEAAWDWDQVIECLCDIKTWLMVSITILNILPNGGIISYGFLIVEGFGYSSFNTTLLTIPSSVITWIAIVAAGYFGSKFHNWRCYVIIATVIPPIIGAVLIYKTESKGTNLLGYYFLSVQPAVFPTLIAMAAGNTRGSSKRVVLNGILFLFYCASNIGAPQLFRAKEAPRYPTAFRSWVVTFCITVLFAVVTRLYLSYENKRRDRLMTEDFEKTVDEGVEITDIKDKSFRYLY